MPKYSYTKPVPYTGGGSTQNAQRIGIPSAQSFRGQTGGGGIFPFIPLGGLGGGDAAADAAAESAAQPQEQSEYQYQAQPSEQVKRHAQQIPIPEPAEKPSKAADPVPEKIRGSGQGKRLTSVKPFEGFSSPNYNAVEKINVSMEYPEVQKMRSGSGQAKRLTSVKPFEGFSSPNYNAVEKINVSMEYPEVQKMRSGSGQAQRLEDVKSIKGKTAAQPTQWIQGQSAPADIKQSANYTRGIVVDDPLTGFIKNAFGVMGGYQAEKNENFVKNPVGAMAAEIVPAVGAGLALSGVGALSAAIPASQAASNVVSFSDLAKVGTAAGMAGSAISKAAAEGNTQLKSGSLRTGSSPNVNIKKELMK